MTELQATYLTKTKPIRKMGPLELTADEWQVVVDYAAKVGGRVHVLGKDCIVHDDIPYSFNQIARAVFEMTDQVERPQ